MSKGLGKIEREILAVLRQSPRGRLFSVDLAIALFKIEIGDSLSDQHQRDRCVTAAQASAVRRALASLQRKGLVECTDRHNQRGRRWWSLAAPESTEIIAALEKSYGRPLTAEEIRLSLEQARDLGEGLIPTAEKSRSTPTISDLIGGDSSVAGWESDGRSRAARI